MHSCGTAYSHHGGFLVQVNTKLVCWIKEIIDFFCSYCSNHNGSTPLVLAKRRGVNKDAIRLLEGLEEQEVKGFNRGAHSKLETMQMADSERWAELEGERVESQSGQIMQPKHDLSWLALSCKAGRVSSKTSHSFKSNNTDPENCSVPALN